MGKGPTFREGNSIRHMARTGTPLWYKECGEVDVRRLRLQLAMEEPGKLTYEARTILRELRGEIQRGKELRTRLLEGRNANVYSSTD